MSVWLKRVLALVIGAVIGLALGGALGWYVWPVEYYDTDLADLHADHQHAYVQMVSEQWALTGDAAQARAALSLLAADPADVAEQAIRDLEARGETNAALRVMQMMEALKRP
jgi:hypothetical protein